MFFLDRNCNSIWRCLQHFHNTRSLEKGYDILKRENVYILSFDRSGLSSPNGSDGNWENDGNANDIGNSVLKVVMLILGLLGILSLAWGFVLYGREAGQGANHLIFVRIAVAMFAALLVLGLLDKII